MRQGLKRVARRRDDALTAVRWDRLEHLLAAYYRDVWYQVTHVGTRATAGRFDGGVDLEPRRERRLLLVQVKHWNAYKVPHSDVHQLIGVMVNARADGAIAVTRAEFTRAAIEAGAKNDQVQVIDGDELRAILGPLLWSPTVDASSVKHLRSSVGRPFSRVAGLAA